MLTEAFLSTNHQSWNLKDIVLYFTKIHFLNAKTKKKKTVSQCVVITLEQKEGAVLTSFNWEMPKQIHSVEVPTNFAVSVCTYIEF